VLALHGRLTVCQRLGAAFGTTMALTVLHSDKATGEAALDASFAEIRALERVASLFDADSQVSRLNRDGRIADADSRLLELLSLSATVASQTGGAFDITVQPYWLAWAGARDHGRPASDDELAAARARVGLSGVVVDGAAVTLRTPGMGVTLNGIARGYATDRITAIIKGYGIAHAFLNTDGVGAMGSKSGAPWTLAIQNPRDPRAYLGEIRPVEGFVSTSGDYEMAFSDDFRDNHIFDPATGRSPTELASATIIAPAGALADGLSTAAMVLGAERTLALVRTLPGVYAVLAAKSGALTVTPGAPFVRS